MRFVDPQFFKKTIRALDKEKAKFFKFNMNKDYVYASCRHCDARISLKKGESMAGYSVLKFKNLHLHKVSRIKYQQ